MSSAGKALRTVPSWWRRRAELNLLELITKGDRNVQVQVWDDAARAWQPHPDPKGLFTKVARPASGSVRGMVLGPGMRVRVMRASRYFPNFAQGRGSFQFCSMNGTSPRVVLGWSEAGSDGIGNAHELQAGADLRAAAIPAAPAGEADLVVDVPPQRDTKLFFGVHRVLDRNELFARCKGTGVEIGPGPKPQVLPGPGTSVQYVEQATPDQWQKLYGKDTRTPVDPALWDLYVVGNADRIPAEPGSLDFIFSSHVIEHLANPLGHFKYWNTLLKPGGVIAGVIPDMLGCKDYVFQPSTLEELDAEYRAGGTEPTLDHYRRWCGIRTPKADPAEVLAAGRSIHVHFYTPESMAAILEARHRELGYSRASVTSSANHKDFFVLLEK